MAETSDQIKNHRDQLKAENDRLNPENDALKQQVLTLTESLRTANDAVADLRTKLKGAGEACGRECDRSKALSDALDVLRATADAAINQLRTESEAAIASLRSTVSAVTAERDAIKTAHNAKAKANAAALAVLLEHANTIL
jgi:chromosome segregation ATPase